MTVEGFIPKRGLVVAIDGPAGAGKSTLARALAQALGLPYLNTGLMYRAVSALALRQGIDPDDGNALAAAARSIGFSVAPDQGRAPELLIDGAPPDVDLASAEVEAVVSRVARHPQVRALLRSAQRALGAGGCVIEGRDIGSVVFTDADVKILLLAAPDVRAGRRERERGGAADVAAAVAIRDSLDARTNPLVPAPDAHVMDTTAFSRDEMLEEALRLVREAIGAGSA